MRPTTPLVWTTVALGVALSLYLVARHALARARARSLIRARDRATAGVSSSARACVR